MALRHLVFNLSTILLYIRLKLSIRQTKIRLIPFLVRRIVNFVSLFPPKAK